MTLFEMTESAKKLYFMLENDEIDEQTFVDTLESIGAAEKLEAYVNVQKTLEAEYEAHKAEKDRHIARMAAISKNIDRLKAAQVEFMKAANITKAKAGTFDLSLRVSQAVEITDESKVPAEYLKPQPPKVDKLAIGKALKDGQTVDGAVLVTRESVMAR